jgi:hypothetical protein
MDKLKGGQADNMTPEDIAKLHNVPLADIERQIKMGMEEEREEHGGDPDEILEIVLDHLVKVVDYYDRIKKVDVDENLSEDGEGGAPATPANITGMGEPVLAQRGAPGSGDVPLGMSKPKKSKRVHSFDEFLKKLKKEG